MITNDMAAGKLRTWPWHQSIIDWYADRMSVIKRCLVTGELLPNYWEEEITYRGVAPVLADATIDFEYYYDQHDLLVKALTLFTFISNTAKENEDGETEESDPED
jgi:hypothetical protein